MLIFLPNDIEDNTTGLEKVGHPNVLIEMSAELIHVPLSWRSCSPMTTWLSGQTGWSWRTSRWACPASSWSRSLTWRASWSGWAWWMPSTWPWATSLVGAFFQMGFWDENRADGDEKSSPLSGLPGMSTNNDLVLSEVVHKAFVDVNEEGTEAAAATAAVMMLRSAFILEKFYADHPFLFFIRHNPSKSILFAGRYCSPEWRQSLRIVVNSLCRGFLLLVLKQYKSYIESHRKGKPHAKVSSACFSHLALCLFSPFVFCTSGVLHRCLELN